MKTQLILAASTLALGAAVAACTPSKPPAARAALDCPAVQGELSRTGVSPDRRTCTYRTGTGDEVTLQLVSTGGDPEGALRGLEGQLMAQVGQAAAVQATAEPAKASAKAEAAAEPTSAAQAADQAAKDASASAKVDAKVETQGEVREDVEVNVPGLRVETREGGRDGDRTQVRLPGIHIVADEGKDEANVKIGGTTIVAKDDAATIRMFREVRLKGEAFSRVKRGVRATFIYTDKAAPAGHRLVGYEAGGPKMGPLTVATVRSGVDRHDASDAYDDIKRLVRRNGGV